MKALAIRPLADSAVTLELADEVGAAAAARVAVAEAAIRRAIQLNHLPGASEVAGAFCSVTVHYDCLQTSQADLVAGLQRLLARLEPADHPAGRSWRLPCCYDAEAGIDLADLATALGLPATEIVARHATVRFRVYALGFLPGLPFMGDLPADLSRPRRAEPRTQVPAGSVAIANRMCVIYPWVSPGGWHIVGQCPVPLFDIRRPVPALLAPGDTVQFRPVTRATAEALRHRAEAGTLDLAALCEGDADA
ncbi:5-oxoprolinase subunit PxpB [Rhodobacter sp. Har01]|uniref:5-oxoprolinase subunit PxpB n=1 Tax=Rhodobacter sp. Har01 TaxID=2883999 RepID=UPI001D062693|nr:5-oxoprolinase subunit PxpB [Rhodobacter sp. Har01]MCB6179423.1 5-oxoprolinase subunit PxpB [Rhodobacter sp. Har01]